MFFISAAGLIFIFAGLTFNNLHVLYREDNCQYDEKGA